MPDTSAPLQEALAFLANRRSLSERLTAQVFGVVMRGEATPAQVAALLMGLRVKGETPDEVAGAARALREAMVRVDAAGPHLVDTCGTGGGAIGDESGRAARKPGRGAAPGAWSRGPGARGAHG